MTTNKPIKFIGLREPKTGRASSLAIYGQLLKIDLLDHIVIGNQQHSSLREMGYFYSS